MDDEDGRCLLDVICDPQALNDFLHGSEKIDSDDLLDNTGEATSAFFEGAGLHVQEAPGNHLNPEPSQPATSVDLDFLEDDILGSPSAGGGGGGGGSGGAEQPCDILQQSLQEANITEQTLEAEAELDLGPFQLPTLQPADGGGASGAGAAAATGAQALFPGSADLLGLQPPAVLTHQALVQPPDVVNVNKALSVQPFLQPVGLGNVTLQPIPGLQGLPNGSPGGAAAAALGLAPIQVVGQSVMALNPPAPQLLAKQVPVGGYLAPAAPAEPGPVTLASAGVSPQGAGLVIQKNLSAAVATTLNGNSVFAGGGVPGPAAAGGAAGPGGQPLAVASGLGASSLVPAPNVILHRTPTPIQPKPAGVLPPKLYQLTPKPFGTTGATLTIQGEAGSLPQPPKAPSNLTFMAAGKAGQNVVLSGFPPTLPANVFKPPPATVGSTPGTSAAPPPGTLSKPMSVHLLNQGSSIVIPAQHMLQGQNQFLLPGAPTVQLPQPISALPANVGGQILAAAAAAPHTGGQLIANPILTNQNLAGPLSLGSVLAPHAGGHGAAHILSAAPIQVGQPTLFQMPVSLAASSLPTQSQPAPAGPTATATVLQGVTLPPSAVAMLNAAEGLVQPATAPAGSETAPVLTVQAAPQAPPTAATVPPVAALPLGLPQQPPPPAPQAPVPTQPTTPQPSPSLASSPEKIVLGQPATTTAVITQESMQMFLPQKERSQQPPYLPLPMEGTHLSLPLPAYSVAVSAPSTSSSAPASVIVSSGAGQPQARDPAPGTPDTKGAGLIPQFPTSQTPPALPPQISAAQQKVAGASSSPSLPHPPPLGDSPHLPSPHPARPPSRPPSRPHSRPPSQPQSVSRPPSEPPLHPCPPPQPLPGLFVIQNPLGPSSHGVPAPATAPTPPLRPPSQPPEGPAPPPTHLQVQLATTTSDAASRLPASAPPDTPHSNSPHFQLQFAPSQVPLKPPTPTPAVHLAPEPPPQPPAPPPPRTFQMVPNPFQALATPAAQSKPLLERFHQVTVPSGLILQGKAAGPPATQQTPPTLGPLASSAPSILVSGQAPPGAQATSSHPPASVASTDSKVFGSSVPTLGGTKVGTGQGKTSGPSPGQYESKVSNLKKPTTIQPSKEACFLEHLHRHQGSVLHPDYKTAFPSFEDALRRLLPYHVYQGALPSPHDHRRVDEEFETVSTQLLRRTQAMLNKYRLLLLEESRRVSPSAEMVMIDRMFIQEEKTTLALDKQLAKEKPEEYVSSSRPHGLSILGSESHSAHRLSCTPAHPPLSSSSSGAPTQLPPHPPTKLVIRHGGAGGSPSVTWARASSSSSSSSSSSAASSLDADEDTPLPSRSRPPIKTYEARSRIGLKLKIKQEAGLSKVVHNTALDPVHHPSPGPKGTEPPAPLPPQVPAPALASSGQMNGTVEHPPAPTDRKPTPPTSQCPRLPLRKTYRENVDAFSSCRAGAPRAATGGSPAPTPAPLIKSDDTTSGLIRELAEVEDELYQRVMKAAPLEVVTPGAGPGAGPGGEPAWEAPPLPPPKRRKSESPDMDNASFSSDSPQDDSLTEHLQSAIDSILNLQQAAPQPSGRTASGPSYPHPATSPPLHRPDGYLGPSHNGGLGARTLNR